MAEQILFGERLRSAIQASTPLCVGIDPSASLLDHWGLADSAEGIESMARSVIEAVDGVACVIKPQIAFFERHGSSGYAALERVLSDAEAAGLMVIADVKRGDIDSSMAAYGDAWLDPQSALCADAMTVTGYMGFGAMSKIVSQAQQHGKGLFVVVASSNPEGRPLQGARLETGLTVEEGLLEELAEINAREIAASHGTCGSIGAVVGATRSAGSLNLASLNGPFLVPGVGAQGATPNDVGALFQDCVRSTVLVNASRSILQAGPETKDIAQAARELGEELAQALV